MRKLVVKILPLALLLGTCALFLSLKGLPFLDLPNHTTRSWVISQLLWGTQYRELFAFDLLFAPYILGDLILASLLRIFPLETGALLYLSLCFAVLPLSVLFYQRSRQIAISLSASTFLLSCFLATNWYFLAAYTNYSLSLGLVFLAMGLWEHFLEERTNTARRITWFLLFLLASTLSYLAHLSGLFFLGLLLGGKTIFRLFRRTVDWRETLATLTPFALLSVLHITRPVTQQDLLSTWIFRSARDKLLGLASMFIRFDYTIDTVYFVAFFALLALALLTGRDRNRAVVAQYREAFRDGDALELALTCLGLLLVYVVMPVGLAAAYDVDGRALPYLFVYLILLTWKVLPNARRAANALFISALLLSVTNLIYLQHYLGKHNQRLVAINQLIKTIPPGKTLLPVATVMEEGRVQTGLHNGALYTVWGQGVTPYIFASAFGEPVIYFHYKHFPRAPLIFWYVWLRDVDWAQVIRDYDLILISKPFDRARLQIPNLRLLAENEAAASFEIVK